MTTDALLWISPRKQAHSPKSDMGEGEARNCLRCLTSFQARRKDQKYCCRDCTKKASRNATRGSTSAFASTARMYTKARHKGLLHWLNRTFYGTKPEDRLPLLSDWLRQAREGDKALREVFSNPVFHSPLGDEKRKVSYRRCRAYPPVPFMGDWLCQKLMGCRVWEWVSGKVPEPETGEVLDRKSQLSLTPYIEAA